MPLDTLSRTAPPQPLLPAPGQVAEDAPGPMRQRSRDAQCLAQLITDSAAGNEDAFAELYDRTHREAHLCALRILRSPAHTVEVLQEAYLEIWLKSRSYDASRGSTMGWIRMIVTRRAIDRVRQVSSASARELADAERSHMTQAGDVGDEVASRVDALRIRSALAVLSAAQSEAVRLKYVEGRSLKYIAAQLEVPLSTVKSRLRDALVRLRTAVEPDRSSAA
jgi:RNA polymerase sigma-70 factor (ECF subfamily)